MSLVETILFGLVVFGGMTIMFGLVIASVFIESMNQKMKEEHPNVYD